MDYLVVLEKLYSSIFPGHSFVGLQQIPRIDSPTEINSYFVINDEHHSYDIVEMSAGEQSVFPILYEFVRQQIAYSITTHSEAVSDIIGEDDTYRLLGDSLCR